MGNTSTTKYYSGQGCLFVADRDSLGNIGPYRDIGNVSELSVTLDATVAEHKESCSGSRLTDARLVTELSASVSMTLQNFTKENLALLFSGQVLDVSGSPPAVTKALYTNTTGAPVVLPIGTVFFTKHLNVNTSPAITFAVAGGTPAAPAVGTNLTYNYTTGQVTLTTTVTVPAGVSFNATYTPLPWSGAMMLKNAINKPRAFLFRGLNTVDTNRPIRVELYNVVLDPAQSFDVLTEEFAEFQVEGSILYDAIRDADTDGDLGPFGRVIGDSTL